MTLADSVLQLVRGRARVEPSTGPESPCRAEGSGEDMTGRFALEGALRAALPAGGEAGDLRPLEPGCADLEAAVSLVSSGLATRVILCGFQSWPGLLWRAYELAETADVLILPTVVRPGGKVDIVITSEPAPHG